MKTDKLAKKLKKELARNWKKSAALGVGCVVAIWFWLPLIAKWTGYDKPAAAPVAAAPPAATTPGGIAGATATENTATKAVGLKWSEIAELMRRDPRALSAKLELARDPFARVQPPPAEPSAEETKTETPVAEVVEVTPQSAGLVLTSTLVSATGGVATISGRAYSVGEMVELAKPEEETPSPANASAAALPTFELVAIYANRVVLSRGTKQYELAMKELQLGKGNRIVVRSTATAAPGER